MARGGVSASLIGAIGRGRQATEMPVLSPCVMDRWIGGKLCLIYALLLAQTEYWVPGHQGFKGLLLHSLRWLGREASRVTDCECHQGFALPVQKRYIHEAHNFKLHTRAFEPVSVF